MNIELKFDYDSSVIYIPDGCVFDAKELQQSFLEWMQNQPECIIKSGYSYNEEDFLRYINNVMLKNSKEKAYFLPCTQNKTSRNFTIVF